MFVVTGTFALCLNPDGTIVSVYSGGDEVMAGTGARLAILTGATRGFVFSACFSGITRASTERSSRKTLVAYRNSRKDVSIP